MFIGLAVISCKIYDMSYIYDTCTKLYRSIVHTIYFIFTNVK